MNIRTIFDLNMRMFKANNSCDHMQQFEVMKTIMEMSEKDIEKVFRKKYFLWNIFRGKDFYKMCAHYVWETVKNGEVDKGLTVLSHVLLTAKDDGIRRAFVKAVVNNVPIVITGTVMYMGQRKLDYLLGEDNVGKLITDEITGPFVKKLKDVYKELNDMRGVVETQFEF